MKTGFSRILHFEMKVLLFALIAFSVCSCVGKNSADEPVSTLNPQDRKVIKALAQELKTHLVVGERVEVIDSALTSLGYVQHGDRYYLNMPSDEFIESFRHSRYATLPDSVYQEQHAEILRQGRALSGIQVVRDKLGKCTDVSLSLEMRYDIEKVRLHFLPLSSSIYETFGAGEYDDWAAGAWKDLGGKQRNGSWHTDCWEEDSINALQRPDFEENYKQGDNQIFMEWVYNNRNNPEGGKDDLYFIKSIFPSEKQDETTHASIYISFPY